MAIEIDFKEEDEMDHIGISKLFSALSEKYSYLFDEEGNFIGDKKQGKNSVN